jgi:hypothetical protein
LEITGLFDELTANKIEEIYAKSSPPGLKVHKVMKSSKAAAVDEKSGNHHHHVIELETTDIEFLFRHAHAEILRFIWGKKQQKQSAADAIIEAAMTEGLLQGGKQLGKNLLKKAAPRLPKENAMMRGIKENVAESLSKFSNQVEEFVERKRHTKAKRGLSKSKTDLAGNL